MDEKYIKDVLKSIIKKLEPTWNEKYELAQKYYEYYGNLEVPASFKTINGYEHDKTGYNLSVWVKQQRLIYNGFGDEPLTTTQIDLLKKIGMRFEMSYDDSTWLKYYGLAKKYYEHYHDLNMPHDFKTTNGYTYDVSGLNLGSWLNMQRQTYKGKRRGHLDSDRIKLLDAIEMKWFSDNIDKKLQAELITESNALSKRKELENRFLSLLNSYDSDKIEFTTLNKNSIDRINNDFLDSLDGPKKITLKK